MIMVLVVTAPAKFKRGPLKILENIEEDLSSRNASVLEKLDYKTYLRS